MNKKAFSLIAVSIIAAVIIGVGIAVAIHFARQASSPETSEPIVETQEMKKEKADAAFKAAQVAMDDANKDEAIKQLDIAQKYYRELGDELALEDVLGQYDVARSIVPDPERTTAETKQP